MAAPGRAKPQPSDNLTKADHKEALGSGERIIGKFHPHPISFIRWYTPSLILLLWTVVFIIVVRFELINLDPLERALGNYHGLALVVFWAVPAVLIGFILPRNPRTSKENVSAGVFLRGVRILYWILIILPIALFTYVAVTDPGRDLSVFVYLYAGLVSALIVLIYDLYRRSFTYYLTNFRVIFRYKFFKNVERTIRFSKIEDVEVSRTLLQRIFKLGNVRPYSGAEESLVDLTPGYDSPDECFFGVKNPEYVKRLMLEMMLGPQDAIQDSVYRTDAAHRGAGGMSGTAVAAGAMAGGTVAAAPAGPDPERIKRLEAELARLRADDVEAGKPKVSVADLPSPAPSPPAQTGAGRPSEVTPKDPAPPSEREHAEFGDDRDALRASDSDFRGAAQTPAKKPAPPGTPAEEDDKPRSI